MPTQNEIRSSITGRIVDALKDGMIPWRKPWTTDEGSSFPTNFATKRPYRGVNVLMLQLAEMENGYPAGLWATYRQWQSLDQQVRRGEKATQIIFYNPVTKTRTKDDGKETQETFPILRIFSVFNVAQVFGDLADQYRHTTPVEAVFNEEGREHLFEAVGATNAVIRYGGNEAVYSRLQDSIRVPHPERFESFPAFAETLLHELAHWTECRLGWEGSYAEGELRAEIGSVFLMQSLGLPLSGDLTNHVAYIQSWLTALENDPKFIFRAASAASKAADFVLKYSRQPEEEPAEEALTTA